MGAIRVATLNVRGLKMVQRRTAIFLSLRMLSFDVLFLQECHLHGYSDVELFSEGWDRGPSLWGVGNVKADGVGILFYSGEFVIESANVIIPGRVIVADVRWRGVAFRFINVYAPSKIEERESFLENIAPVLYTNRFIVLGGDFNVSLDNASGVNLARLVGEFSLRDSFRVAGGIEPAYTWRNSRQGASRLDYLFLPDKVRAGNYTQRPMWCTDHCLVGVWVEVGGLKRGRGVWRFNTSFLEERSFVLVLQRLLVCWKNLRGLYDSQAAWWEGVKERVAFFCRCWGIAKAQRKRAQVCKWSEELQTLWSGGALGTAEGWERAVFLKGAIKDFYGGEAKAFVLWAGTQKRQLDEKPTRYFFSSVRGRQQRSCMEGLQGREGVVSNVEGMLRVAASFYGELFSGKGCVDPAAGGFLEGLTDVLKEKESLGLEGPLSLQEVESALFSLKKGTAPGGDGLPVEFYRAFWPLVGVELVEVYQESLGKGELPLTMRTGLVTLLYKKGKKEDLANWRPITLLTTDYKVLAKVITERLKSVVGLVVHPDQTCGVPGRSGSWNLALVRDIISWVEQRQLSLGILSLDQEKAFDRVSHAFLMSVLEQLRFGPIFRAWIRLLYTRVKSRIGVNGFYSELVEQQGGVRQGCPLSPLLYILSLEPLMAALRSAPALTGVHLPGGRGVSAKVAAYADDMTLFLTSEQDFVVADRILQEFCKVSGARVNVNKSSALFAGRWAERTVVPGGYSLCPDGMKILGVRFFRRNSAHENWEARLKVVQAKVVRWNSRGLSLWGRVEVVRADLLPSLNYLAYIFPVPFWCGRKLERLVFSFIWRNGAEMVARTQMFRHRREGGRGVPCIPLKMEALFSSFAVGLVARNTEHKARFLAQFWLAFSLRSMIAWRGTRPWSADRPEHYQKVVDLIVRKPWCLEQSLILEHRKLYSRVRDELVKEAERVVPPYGVEWSILQPSFLAGYCKDLNWLAALGRLPVRERLYRHGQVRTPLCPVGCGQEETIEHALWSCPGAAVLWQLVERWWRKWGGPVIRRDLVLRGEGLKEMGQEHRKVVWGVISQGKYILWEWRTTCVKKQLPRMVPQRLFGRLLGKIVIEVKAYKECYGEEEARRVWGGLPRVGVG